MRHVGRLHEPRSSSGRPISSRRRRWLRWVFAVIFGACSTHLVAPPVQARQVPFASQQVISILADSARSVFSADVDGDGDQDVLSASYHDDKIAWYENIDGAGTFGSQQVISTADGSVSVFSSDVDGDGDQDALSASATDDKIAWYENTDGAGTFGSQQVISTLADGASSVFAADVDGDGDQDALAASLYDNKIAWFENTDGAGTFGSQQAISTLASLAFSVFAADVDGDGDLDVLSASLGDDKIAWYENTDGAGAFGSQRVITTLADVARSVFSADVDGDGDLDVLSASEFDDKIAWYENTDGAGTFGSQQVISTKADEARSVFAVDVDGDGDLDVLSASRYDDEIAWYENETIHRSALFPQQTAISTLAGSARSVFSADVDGDGDQDVLSASASDDKIAWYENTDGAGAFGSQQVITTLADAAFSVFSADVDGDGDLDVLSASFYDDKIAWHENTDGAGAFGSQQVITTLADLAFSVFAADVDGDGDQDVLSASGFDDKIAWYENTDGAGTFGPQQVITTLAEFTLSVFSADVDGDGDQDALSASRDDDKVAWYENTDGAGTFGAQLVITTVADGALSVYAADVDGDGDLDVLSGSQYDGKVAWYENLDGAGTFGAQQVITTVAENARSVSAADVDGDGDLDVLSASEDDNKIAWYENTDGAGTFGSQQVITSVASEARSVFTSDLDGDGDLDVLSASRADDTIAWYENRGGQFSLATIDVAQGVVANGQLEDVLAIQVIHNGRTGDSPLELASLELRLTDGAGSALTELQALALLQTIRVYLDEGTGVFEGTESLVISTSDFSSITANGNGVLTVPFVDGDANAQVDFGTPRTFLVVAEMTANADAQAPSALAFEHRTESSTEAEDANADIPLTLEFVENLQGGKVDTTLTTASCQAPFDLNLENQAVVTTVVCEAGTVLTAGNAVTVISPGSLTLRGGQSVELADDFSVESGTFEAEIDPGLLP